MPAARPAEIQQAESSVAEARAQMELARADWERAQTLYKNDDISTSQFDQYAHQIQRRYCRPGASRRPRSALVQEGPRKEEIAGARAQLARAQAAVRTGASQPPGLRRKQEQLAQLRADIDRARAQVGITERAARRHAYHLPIDGVVLVKSAEPGEVLAAGTTVVTIGDVDHPWLRAYINETDLGRVKLGAKVQAHHRFVSRKNLSRAASRSSPRRPSSRPSRFRPRRSA